MQRIYKVCLTEVYDHATYYVQAISITEACFTAVDAERKSLAARILRNDADMLDIRVTHVTEFCKASQFIRS